MNEDHLFVLIHGLWGNPTHMNQLRATVKKQYPDAQILVPSGFSGTLTYDGVVICGNRVIKETRQKIKEVQESKSITVTKFSIVGYSFGGLMARYIVGELDRTGFFDTIKPKNFTTFATPHLGTSTGRKDLLRRLFTQYGRYMLSQSGRDMFHKDGAGGILALLADPESVYYRVLSEKFERISLYANAANDRTVPFFTAFITTRDPFTDVHNCKPQYLEDASPVIVDLSKPMSYVAGKPTRAPWSRRQYILFISLITIGPIVITLTLLGFMVTTQISEARIRKLSKQAGRAIELSSNKSTATLIPSDQDSSIDLSKTEHHETEASIMQSAVENFMDATGSPDDTPSAPEAPTFSITTSPPLHRAPSTTSLTTICTALHEHRVSHPEFAKRSFCDDLPEPESMLELEPIQLEIEASLNRLPWHKYAVHVQSTPMAHAAMINRRRIFEEGKVVLQHWVERLVD
ncbi:putative serine esterase-domain-containing protein [Myxozyma melibiosi]|uniref:Serine esterase-domain-containing protein n=1 Tax=Myxozyma melibiosi TaxID=54550 RepID=A0ABR1F5Z8_9ASCO